MKKPLAADAMSRLFFESFNEWVETTKQQTFLTTDVKTLIDHFSNLSKEYEIDQNFLELLINRLEEYEDLFAEFSNVGYLSSTFKYWHFFIETIDLLWKMLRAERDGDFNSHLIAVTDLLPYLSAAGRNLYFKWTPVYLSDMEELKQKHSDMYKFLADGNFVVKKTNEKAFNCVASDMALEQSINKDCKSRSGILGFSQEPRALLRWIITRHTLGEYSEKFIGTNMFYS